MATRFKYSIAKGQTKKDVTLGAGDTVGTDTITVNIDATTLTREEVIRQMDELVRAMLEGKWFPV